MSVETGAVWGTGISRSLQTLGCHNRLACNPQARIGLHPAPKPSKMRVDPMERSAPKTRSLKNIRLPKICVAVQAATPAEMMSRAEAALKQSRFLEFRLDALAEPASGIS